MNKIFNIIFKDLKKDKSIYFSLIIVCIISFIFGLFFITILKDSDKTLLSTHINSFFENISSNNYKANINNIVFKNDITAIIIFILGFSIIGIPVLIAILFYKGFTLFFTITSLIYTFKTDGIYLSFVYVFPHLIINFIFYFILVYYAFKLSLMFINYIINKKELNKNYLKKYVVCLLISLAFITLSGLYETFIFPLLIKMIY